MASTSETEVRERELEDAQYAGEKALLRPILLKLKGAARGLGDDVRVEADATGVRFSRHTPFAAVVPESATQVDLGLVLSDAPAHDRLIPAHDLGAPGVTRRVPLTNLDDVDGEVLAWLRLAYEQSGR